MIYFNSLQAEHNGVLYVLSEHGGDVNRNRSIDSLFSCSSQPVQHILVLIFRKVSIVVTQRWALLSPLSRGPDCPRMVLQHSGKGVSSHMQLNRFCAEVTVAQHQTTSGWRRWSRLPSLPRRI